MATGVSAHVKFSTVNATSASAWERHMALGDLAAAIQEARSKSPVRTVERTRSPERGGTPIRGRSPARGATPVRGRSPVRQESPPPRNGLPSSASVVVVGGGIAGLYAAHLLQRAGIDVVVLEASDCVGGRIRQHEGIVDWKPIDLGAELVHGRALVHKLANEQGWNTYLLHTWAQGDGKSVKGAEDIVYYLGGEKRIVGWKDPDVARVNDLLFGLGELREAPIGTLEDYLRLHGVPERVIGLASAGFANTLCSPLNDLDVHTTARLEKNLEEDAYGDYMLEGGMKMLINHYARGLNVITRWPVSKIDYTDPNAVVVTSKTGEVIKANRLVVAVPVTVLKDNDITFVPALPVEKRMALKFIKMHNAMKIICVFKDNFVPDHMDGIICADSPVPEIWFDHDEDNKDPSKPKTYCATGFACADFADRLLTLGSDEKIVQAMTQQLDEMFGTPERPHPASDSIVRHLVWDWSKQPFIKGGYSTTSAGAVQAREFLGRPINNRIFFCGEATNSRICMTIDAAMESSQRVFGEISGAMHQPRL